MQLSDIVILDQPIYRIRLAQRGEPHYPGDVRRLKYRYFVGTRAQCVKRIAWWYVWHKYGAMNQEQQEAHLHLECLCNSYDPEGWGQPLPNGCPIHDREDGYLIRLVKRLAVQIDQHFADLVVVQYKEKTYTPRTRA